MEEIIDRASDYLTVGISKIIRQWPGDLSDRPAGRE